MAPLSWATNTLRSSKARARNFNYASHPSSLLLLNYAGYPEGRVFGGKGVTVEELVCACVNEWAC